MNISTNGTFFSIAWPIRKENIVEAPLCPPVDELMGNNLQQVAIIVLMRVYMKKRHLLVMPQNLYGSGPTRS